MENDLADSTRVTALVASQLGVLEVVVLVEIVARNGFVEAQAAVVPHAQDAVGWQRLAKDARTAGVLYAAQHFRRPRDEAAAMTAEADGAQVVALFYWVAFTIEADVLNASAQNHGLGAAGSPI